MAAGRVQHWKHGWIPLTPEARAFSAGLGPRPVTSRESSGATSVMKPKRRIVASKASGIEWRDGYWPPTDAQRREVAKIVKAFQAEFPGLEGPVPISVVTRDDMHDLAGDDSWGTTNSRADSGYEITLNDSLWDDDAELMRLMKDNRVGRSVVGSIAAAGRTPAQVRRAIITHELSHVLHLRSDRAQKVRGIAGGGPLSEIANETVTPRSMGFKGGAMVDTKVPRWTTDHLDMKSAYAMGQNRYEWIAEALTDALINGEDASDSSKRILAAARSEYGA